MPAVIDVELAYREPMDAEGVIAYLARRAIPGVEEIVDGAYRRSIRLPGGAGIIELAPGDGRIKARYLLDHRNDETDAVERSRLLFDLDTDPQPVFDALQADPLIGPLIRANPGRRVPGHVDPDEIAFRAVLGQQVSLAGAATLAGRLVVDYGDPLRAPLGSVTHLFPRAGALANADPERLPMPASRRRALIGLAKALDEGGVKLGAAADRAEARRAASRVARDRPVDRRLCGAQGAARPRRVPAVRPRPAPSARAIGPRRQSRQRHKARRKLAPIPRVRAHASVGNPRESVCFRQESVVSTD